MEKEDLDSLLKLKDDLEPVGTAAEVRQTIKFSITGQRRGKYRAVVSVLSNRFCLDAVYREPPRGKGARINIALPERYIHNVFIYYQYRCA